MPSISDIVLSNIESISESYALNITEPGQIINNLAQRLRDDKAFIHTFDRIAPITDKSMIAVDGGNAKEQLSGGDLVVAGATIGEGLNTKQLYASSEQYPSEAFFQFLPHSSNNAKIEAAIRAALELRVLEASPADIKIIDGAYVGNVSNVLYALIDQDPLVSNAILELNDFDLDGLLGKAITNILNPSRDNPANVFAVVKNDSSTVYIKELMADYKIEKLTLTDRILASRILHPGEFFRPRNLNSNPGLIASIRKTVGSPDFGAKSSNKSKLMGYLRHNGEALQRLSSENTEEGILWTTYFKPTAWSEYAKAIKVEFPYYPSQTSEGVVAHARKIVQIIDQDIVEENILEPWCQYTADIGAKGVSHAMTMVKGHLLATADESDALRGLVRNYRT